MTLGSSDLDDLARHVEQLLRRRRVRVVLDVVDFEYFDEQTLTELVDLVAVDDRIELRGIDNYASLLLDSQPAAVVDVRSVAEQMVTNLEMVTVVTASWQDGPIDDATWEEALALAASAARRLVTVDLRNVNGLTTHQLFVLAEFSADLVCADRTLVIVNVMPHLNRQLRMCGLHGDLLIGADVT